MPTARSLRLLYDGVLQYMLEKRRSRNFICVSSVAARLSPYSSGGIDGDDLHDPDSIANTREVR
ncbi:hypothetical protein GQ600_4814 [Phytophthora cactorum]|nr:hypothetical protein GQ600_4814 [Phytophthora cactorum]